jgi:hypothetical protein
VKLRHSKPSIYDSTDIQEDLRLLFLESNCSNNQSNNQTYRRQSSLSLMIRNPTTTVHYFWRKFDDKFMRPIFGGRGFVPVVPGSPSAEEDISWTASKYYLFCFHFLVSGLNIKDTTCTDDLLTYNYTINVIFELLYLKAHIIGILHLQYKSTYLLSCHSCCYMEYQRWQNL